MRKSTKISVVVVVLILFTFILFGCTKSDNEIEIGAYEEDQNIELASDLNSEVRIGTYVANEGFAHLIIEEDKTCLLHRDASSGYAPAGEYTINEDILVLSLGDQPEVFDVEFKISGDILIFESGEIEANFIKRGTEFVYRDEYVSYEELEKEYLESSGKDRFMKDIEFGIGDSTDQLVEKWGEPISSDYLDGGLYMEYEDVVFYTNGHIEYDGTYTYGTIVAIGVTEGYGVKKGMTIEESREVLGEPDSRDIFDELREAGHGLIDPKDYYYKGDYTLSISYNPDINLVYSIDLNKSRIEGDIVGNGFLELTDWELRKYEDYILDFDDNKLYFCTPINIMKMYIHALKEQNYEAQWELYTKEENQLGWDKEYHMTTLAKDDKRDFSEFSNAINIEVSYGDDYDYAVISWEDKYLEEYDGFGTTFRYSFHIVGDKDEYGNTVWKVGFRPMQ